MSKHTKGPWMVKEKPFCISVESEDDILSDLYLSDEDDAYAREHRAICYANARLIAAAPCLLQALEEIAKMVEYDDSIAYETAMNAIAKARGEA